MEQKTKAAAEPGKHDILITRDFDLPVELVWRAHTEPELIEQWKTPPQITARVIKHAGQKHGSFEMQGTDASGNVVFTTHGVIHEFIPPKKIIRTFEAKGSPVGVQLEVYDFEPLSDDTSRLKLNIIYQSAELRDKALQMPVGEFRDRSHNKMQELMAKFKQPKH